MSNPHQPNRNVALPPWQQQQQPPQRQPSPLQTGPIQMPPNPQGTGYGPTVGPQQNAGQQRPPGNGGQQHNGGQRRQQLPPQNGPQQGQRKHPQQGQPPQQGKRPQQHPQTQIQQLPPQPPPPQHPQAPVSPQMSPEELATAQEKVRDYMTWYFYTSLVGIFFCCYLGIGAIAMVIVGVLLIKNANSLGVKVEPKFQIAFILPCVSIGLWILCLIISLGWNN